MNAVSGAITTLAIIVAALGGAAGIVAFFQIGPNRRKISAEAFRAGVDSVEALNRTAISLNEPYLQQIKFLTAELANTQTRMAEYSKQLASAQDQIAMLRQELRTYQMGLP